MKITLQCVVLMILLLPVIPFVLAIVFSSYIWEKMGEVTLGHVDW